MNSQINIKNTNSKQNTTIINKQNTTNRNKKNISIYDYNNSKNYEINYDKDDLLYLEDLKNLLKNNFNINYNNSIFLNNFIIIKNTQILNNIKNIIIIDKNFFSINKFISNKNTINHKKIHSSCDYSDELINYDSDYDSNNTNINNNNNNNNFNLIINGSFIPNSNINTIDQIKTKNNNLHNNDLLHKYFKLFDKYPDLIIFVYLLNYDINLDGIIQFLESFSNKIVFNIIKNNQKEIIKMSSDYPNILHLYYKEILSYSNRNIFEIITSLRNTNNPNSLIISDILNMFPNSSTANIEELLNLFTYNNLII